MDMGWQDASHAGQLFWFAICGSASRKITDPPISTWVHDGDMGSPVPTAGHIARVSADGEPIHSSAPPVAASGESTGAPSLLSSFCLDLRLRFFFGWLSDSLSLI